MMIDAKRNMGICGICFFFCSFMFFHDFSAFVHTYTHHYTSTWYSDSHRFSMGRSNRCLDLSAFARVGRESLVVVLGASGALGIGIPKEQPHGWMDGWMDGWTISCWELGNSEVFSLLSFRQVNLDRQRYIFFGDTRTHLKDIRYISALQIHKHPEYHIVPRCSKSPRKQSIGKMIRKRTSNRLGNPGNFQ